MIFKFVTFFLLWHTTTGSPLIIRSTLGKFDDHSAGHQGNIFGVNTQLGASDYAGGDGFDAGNLKKFNSGENSGNFAADQRDKVVNLDEGKFGSDVFHKVGGGAVSDFDKNVAHKKGHNKSGFHNTYHKDESGSNSSFFDDLNDEGGKYEHDSRKNQFGDASDKRQQGYHSNGNNYDKLNTNRGGYSTGDQYRNDRGDRNAYNRERFYNDRLVGSRNNGAERYGNSDRRGIEENRYQSHPRYDPYYNRKITVYEDPYYKGNNYNYDAGLDFRTRGNPYTQDRYYNRHQDYDYYY